LIAVQLHRCFFPERNSAVPGILGARILGALLLLVLLAVCFEKPSHAEGEGHHYWVSQDPSVGYAVPIQRVYQFPAAFVFQPTRLDGYAVPIQRVYQFPAASVFQPGPEVPFGGVLNSAYDQYAGPSFIPR
jgi:hypothetical protein